MRNKNNGFDWRGRMGYWGREDSPKPASSPSADRRKPRDYCNEYCGGDQDQEAESLKTFIKVVGLTLLSMGVVMLL